MTPNPSNIARLSDEALEKLSNSRIYFAHQSVGYNILDGLQDHLREDQRLKIKILETTDATQLRGGVLVHTRVGKNGDPVLKIHEFENMVEHGLGNNADFAILKFCYIDFDGTTDIEGLFARYRQTLEKLKTMYPATTFIHLTVPLCVRAKGAKIWARDILGYLSYGDAENVKRNLYNDKVRREYQGKEPLFDLAAAESTYPDGKREGFTKEGMRYYSLIPGYSSDEGHLNETGRKIVAARLIEYLAALIQSQ